MNAVPASQIVAELQQFVDTHDTAVLAAKALRITPSQLSLILRGKASVIHARVLKRLGYVGTYAYFKADEAPKAKKAAAKKPVAKKAARPKPKKPAKPQPAGSTAQVRRAKTSVDVRAEEAEAVRNVDAVLDADDFPPAAPVISIHG